MTKLRVAITTLVSLFASFPVFAEMGVDEKINLAVKPYADAVAGFVFSSFPVGGVQIPFVLVWLIVAATIFTFYFNFINIRAFKHGFSLVRGDYHDPDAPGEVTHFQALATALSGTVGLGNIAGVAIARHCCITGWPWRNVLDDTGWFSWHVFKVHRMHTGCEIPQ